MGITIWKLHYAVIITADKENKMNIKDELVQEATQNAVGKIMSWAKSQLFGRRKKAAEAKLLPPEPSVYEVVTVTYETAIRNTVIKTQSEADALAIYEMTCNANKQVQVCYLVDGKIAKSRW
jgi:hypothetical protein